MGPSQPLFRLDTRSRTPARSSGYSSLLPENNRLSRDIDKSHTPRPRPAIYPLLVLLCWRSSVTAHLIATDTARIADADADDTTDVADLPGQ